MLIQSNSNIQTHSNLRARAHTSDPAPQLSTDLVTLSSSEDGRSVLAKAFPVVAVGGVAAGVGYLAGSAVQSAGLIGGVGATLAVGVGGAVAGYAWGNGTSSGIRGAIAGGVAGAAVVTAAVGVAIGAVTGSAATTAAIMGGGAAAFGLFQTLREG